MGTEDDANKVYGGMVADIIAAVPRESNWEPASPIELYVRDRRAPALAANLSGIERLQVAHMFERPDLEKSIIEGTADLPPDLEIANVVDEAGTPLFRLYGMNYGVIYLMKPDTLECVAFACQHDLEHWHTNQRELFWAMDRAMRRNDHGFQQPLKFCWWEQTCWDEIEGSDPGAMHNESYVRQKFAGKN